mgnify:CR=1 FL=1
MDDRLNIVYLSVMIWENSSVVMVRVLKPRTWIGLQQRGFSLTGYIQMRWPVVRQEGA